MKQIRKGIFETNSSSTHSMTMCSGDEFDAWVNGDTFYDNDTREFYPKAAAISKVRADLAKWDNIHTDEEYQAWLDDNYGGDEVEMLRESEFCTYDNWGDEYYDQFEEEYVTASGERVIAFGEYGRDG